MSTTPTLLERVKALLETDEQWIKDQLHAAINLLDGIHAERNAPADPETPKAPDTPPVA